MINGLVAAQTADVADAAVRWLSTANPQPTRTVQRYPKGSLFCLAVKLAAGPGLQGWLLFGARLDGSQFGADEIQALESLSDHLATAFAVAQQRERNDDQINSRLERIESLLREQGLIAVV